MLHLNLIRFPYFSIVPIKIAIYVYPFSDTECYYGKIKGLPGFLPEVLLMLSLSPKCSSR